MTEYQFGREVTVKLPEPERSYDLDGTEDSVVTWSRPDLKVRGTTYLRQVSFTTDGPLGLMGMNLSPGRARTLGELLIAAADYAENGGEA